MSKTALDILKFVYRKVEGDTEYPDFEDDDMQLWFGLLQDSIDEWLDRFPKLRESFADLADASDGDKVTSAGVTEYDAPTNFVRPANFIKIGDKRLEYLPPEKMELYKSQNSLSEWFSITGRPGAYKIVINPAPSGSDPISYPYYKTIAKPTAQNDVIEVSRPNFCAYYILSNIYLDDQANKDLAVMYDDKMDEEERREKVQLVMTPTGTPNRMGDMGYVRFGAGFGQTTSDVE